MAGLLRSWICANVPRAAQRLLRQATPEHLAGEPQALLLSFTFEHSNKAALQASRYISKMFWDVSMVA